MIDSINQGSEHETWFSSVHGFNRFGEGNRIETSLLILKEK